MEGSAMSLSTWEQQALDSIKDDLADCDPALVARLTIFTRLASGEAMPTGEKVHIGSQRAVRRSRPEPRHTRRPYQRLGLQQAVMLLWLVTTVALIAIALACNHGGWPAHARDPGQRSAPVRHPHPIRSRAFPEIARVCGATSSARSRNRGSPGP
jgi:hypothetical protein